jgi:hypothetical protein
MSTKLKALLGAIAMTASLIAALPVVSTSAATCAAPTLLEAMVSQGLPHNGVDKNGKANPPLVRGKTALVKFFLGVPSGALSVQVKPTSRLDVFNGTTKLNTTTISPTGALSTITSAAKSDDSSGDPKFSVPGTVLAPTSPTTSWPAKFTGVLDYSTTPTLGLPCTGSISYSVTATVAQRTGAPRVLVVSMGDGSLSPLTQFTKETQSGQQSNALQAVQDGFTALSRVLPVADGVADLDNTTSTAGIRWHLNAGMLPLNDLGIAKDGEKYCLNDFNFSQIATKLDTYLQAWNSAQKTSTTTADRVLGVIDSNIAWGIERLGCWDGAAQTNTVHAWARAVHDTGEAADKIRESGPLFGMELLHTIGLKVPTTAGGTGDSTYHSTSETADVTNPNRGYNTFTNSFVSAPRTVMELRTPFTNANTLTEQSDWADVLCALGGPTTTTCGGQNSKVTLNVGSTANVAATGRFYFNALSDGKPEGTPNVYGTRITDAYYTTTKFETPDDPNSPYHFAAFDSAGNTLVDKRVTLQTNTSEHPEEGDLLLPSRCPVPYSVETCGTFSFAVTLPSQLASYELWEGAPRLAGSTRLTGRIARAKPVVTSVNVTNEPQGSPVDLTKDPNADETEPAITADGKWLLYTRTPAAIGQQQACTELVARDILPSGTLGNKTFYLPGGDTTDLTQPLLGKICHSGRPDQGAWRADGRAGAFVQDGNLFVFDFDQANGFTNPQVVLACAGATSLGACVSSSSPQRLSSISNPSWSPDSNWPKAVTGGSGYRLSFDATSVIQPGRRDLYYMDPYSPIIDLGGGQGVHPAALVSQQAVESSWSNATGKGKTLEYTDVSVTTGSPIRLIDVGNSSLPTTGTQVSCCGRRGSFGDRFIAIEEEADDGSPTGNIALLDYNSANLTPVPDRKTETGRDTSPSLTSTLVAGKPFSQLLVFDRQDASSHEIYLYNLDSGDRRSLTASGTVSTQNAPYATATFVVQCNGLANPVDTVVPWSWSKDLGNGLTALRFNTTLDHSEICGDPNPSDPSADAPRAGATIDDQALVSDLVYGGGIGTTRKPPSASILHTTGTSVSWENLNLVGSGVDSWFGALTGPNAVWKLYAPDGSLYATQTGEVTVIPVPAVGYFAPGTWTVTFTVTNPWGGTATDTERVKMQAPMKAASSVNFDPDSLTVPIDTSGSPNVIVYITANGMDLSKIPKASVAITSIDGNDVSGDSSLAALTWSASGPTAQATFDKTSLTTKIHSFGGPFPRNVRVTITGTSGSTAGSFAFTATDATAPCAHLQTQGSTC